MKRLPYSFPRFFHSDLAIMPALDALCDSVLPCHPLGSTKSSVACCKLLESSTTFHLTFLPDELIVKILDWCDFKEVIACQLVCD
jgi:hypothetical protein